MPRAAIWLTLTFTVACREGRSGVPETGSPDVALKADSVWPEEVRPLTAQVERLIGQYEERMRAAAK